MNIYKLTLIFLPFFSCLFEQYWK